MKKFLSLVLALVMTMSLVTISAGASFTDDSKVDYNEAVDVISAMGIVGGYADGSFKPQGTLTRGAAAKIICNMMLGVKDAAELPSIASYKDVPAGSTYAPYIAYLKNEGVVGGYADGSFKPGNTLTGYAFLKMLLGAIGYDAQVEGLQGDGWQINVAKLAKKAKLYDGNDSFNGNLPATREEACLYAFNTMYAATKEYEDSSSITIGDVVIKNNSKAKDTGKLFYEANFDTLKKNVAGSDSQGRPGTTWEYGKGADKKTIGTYGSKADHVLTAKDAWTDTLAELRKALDNKDLTAADGSSTVYYVNKDTAGALSIGSGDVVEVFTNSANSNIVDRVVVSHYALGEITKVETNVTNKKDIKDGVTAYITVKVSGSTTRYKSINFAGYDADTYVKGAMILVCAGVESVATGKTTPMVFDSAIAETVEGKVTAVKGSKVTIDGTVYKNVDAGWTPAIDNAGVFYLDKAGNITKADLTTSGTVDQYVYVYGANVKQDTVSDDGVKLDNVFTLYAVNAAGEKVSFKVKKHDDVMKFFSVATVSGKSVYSVKADADVKVTAYKLDDDGYFETVADAADWTVHQGTTALGKTSTTTTTAKVTVAGGDAYYAGNDTQFVFASKKDDAMKVTTSVGYKNVNIKANEYYIVSKDSDIKVVFSFKKDAGAAADETYVLGVVTDATATVTKDGSDTFRTYVALVDGVETELTKKNGSLSLTKGHIYKFTMDGDYVSAVAELDATSIVKVAADDTYFVGANGTEYALDNDATVYTVYENYKSEGGVISLDNYTVTSDTTLTSGTVVSIYKDKDDNYTYFFQKSNYADFT